MKFDLLRRTLRIGLLTALLSQFFGCACIIWGNSHPLRISHKFIFADETVVGSDGRVALRFQNWDGSGEDRYLEFSGVEFQKALRAHLGLAQSPAAESDGALPWPSDRIVTMNLRSDYLWDSVRAHFVASRIHDWPPSISKVRYVAPRCGQTIFPCEMDGVTYQIAVEFDSEHSYSPCWVYPVYVPCAAVDIVTLPLQVGVVVLCWLVYFGASAASL